MRETDDAGRLCHSTGNKRNIMPATTREAEARHPPFCTSLNITYGLPLNKSDSPRFVTIKFLYA